MTQSKKRLGLSVPLTLHVKLVDLANYQGKTINSLCLDIFWEYFEPGKKCSNTTNFEDTDNQKRKETDN